jgi:HAT1-interacting factor 1
VSINDAGAESERGNALNSLLGQILNQSPADQKSRLEEAAKGANDLSGLVRKKKPAVKEPAEQAETQVTKKRAASDDSGSGKRVKMEDVPED